MGGTPHRCPGRHPRSRCLSGMVDTGLTAVRGPLSQNQSGPHVPVWLTGGDPCPRRWAQARAPLSSACPPHGRDPCLEAGGTVSFRQFAVRPWSLRLHCSGNCGSPLPSRSLCSPWAFAPMGSAQHLAVHLSGPSGLGERWGHVGGEEGGSGSRRGRGAGPARRSRRTWSLLLMHPPLALLSGVPPLLLGSGLSPVSRAPGWRRRFVSRGDPGCVRT